MARPKKEIDYGLVERLAAIHCTQDEIAEVVGVSVKTLQRDKEFCRLYKKGISAGKMSLRRKQWEAANKGNTTMLIWLGKQYLDQKDDKEQNEFRRKELELRELELKDRIDTGEDDDNNIDNYIAALEGQVAEVFQDYGNKEKA